MTHWAHRLADWWSPPAPPPADIPAPSRGVSTVALAEASASYGAPLEPWQLPTAAPRVLPAGALAMDATPMVPTADMFAWAVNSRFHEGMAFLGYPYLAELAQRPEYRRASEIIAADATRKWIKLNGPDEAKIKELEDALKTHGIQEKFRRIAELDGFFGRSQLFIDNGERALDTRLVVDPATLGKGKLKALTIVEPVWTYPGIYEATNPLDSDFYRPKYWYVMGNTVDRSRLLTFVGREVPDMLKPTYAFGGLSLSQMGKPYVDNWLRTRQSVSDLVHAFSTMVLSTDMSSILGGSGAEPLLRRIELFNRMRDNRGTMVINHEAETLENIAVPLGTLDALQAQSQEQMASVWGIPLVVLLGVTPSGLNASSDGEIRTYYATIKGYQERVFRPHLKTVIDIIQLDTFGVVDPKITFEFVSLWEMDETAAAAIRKSDAEADCEYIAAGAVSPDEVRERLVEDEQGLYFGVDLSASAPEAPDDAAVLAGLVDGGPNDD